MLLQTASVPHDWFGLAATLLAGLIVGGGGVAWFSAWQQRRKVPAEIHEANSRTSLTLVKANRSAAELVLEAGNTLFGLQEKAIALRNELDAATRRSQADDLEKEMLREQMKRMAKILDNHKLTHELADIFKKEA